MDHAVTVGNVMTFVGVFAGAGLVIGICVLILWAVAQGYRH